ncbi:tetraacyldisaccharide 4'-kinase [Maribacter sp. 2307UL18-2]|uniref:tetraacyldisaccharide 4'-kinase n=1 Tax=Maribacter sp. 2307UL18-2 TaxID=3386274 RepID=UPI0039BD2A9D
MWLLRKIAFPFSLMYALAVYVRNKLYDIGVLTSEHYETPTICVGNLSVGGTGKTPMIEYLIRYFGHSHQIAVLSRGYRRKSKGFVLAASTSTVEELGDEPYQIHFKFPEVRVAVDSDRRNGIVQLQKRVGPDLILLDDAFQHRRVKADMNILLTSFESLYIDDWYLPSGNLRDGLSQVNRAQYVVVTKCPENLSLSEKDQIKRKLGVQDTKTILFSYLKYDGELRSEGAPLPLQDLSGKRVTLVTGIANPEPFVHYLKSKGITIDHMAFKDHHFFTSREIASFKTKELLVTTEKDYVRLKGKVANLYYLPIRHVFFEEDEAVLLSGLEGFMMPNP